MKATKKIILILSAILVSASLVFALTYKSANYTIEDVNIVSSGGKAASFNYSLNDVRIADIIGGKATSTNYSLDASNIIELDPPNPPLVNPVISPSG